GFVFFNPEQHTSAWAVAAAFAVLLLPFSVVAPFAGVLIDRWPRRQVLLFSALIKAALGVLSAVLVAQGAGPEFFIAALLVLSVNRFFLSGLRSEEHTSELQSRFDIVCSLLLVNKTNTTNT